MPLRRLAAAASLLAFAVTGAAAQPAPATAYVILGPQGPVARAVYENAPACPSLTLDGTAQQMSERLSPQNGGSKFPLRVCELLIPAGTTSAMLGSQTLPLPPATFKSAAVIGDTGCRLQRGNRFQDCNDHDTWPFPVLAASIAGQKPQVVVHVGDYIYRESRCPSGNKGCAGSPTGDKWDTWVADFFEPAKDLLAIAPWVAVRGNHESCTRAGFGFTLFLDPTLAKDQPQPSCLPMIPQFSVDVGGQQIIVLDSSSARDNCAPGACNSDDYATQFANMRAKNAWLVTHRPIWAFITSYSSPINATLQSALKQWQGKLPPGIALALAGHIHLWEVLSFADHRTPQFVVGNSGTSLDRRIDGSLRGLTVDTTTVSYGKSTNEWGYTIFAPNTGASGWTANNYDVKGNPAFSCTVTSSSVSCP